MTLGGQVLKAKVRVPRVKAVTRERLDALLARVWDARLGVVIAPAGSGKTTLLAQFAGAAGVPVAWYRAEAGDSGDDALVAHLERSLTAAFEGLPTGWTSIDDAIDALEDWPGERALVVVDELDAIWGTDAEAALERFVLHVRPGVPVLAATRRAPTFNLSKLRVQGDLVQIGEEDLRFRSWEVERLFHDFYGDPVPPQELAELARRTAGWAAGLQLFHLATRGKPAGERRRVLQELGLRSRLVREYLARNVLDDLPVHVRDFLLRTCVLGRLTPSLCDELTTSTSGAAILADLEQRQIFTAALDDGDSYRYHEVLRTHLEAVLLETLGETEARARYHTAGALLERHGYLPEALRAYLRAEDHDAAHRLLGGWGERVIDRPSEWLDALPPAMLDQDAWLLLGSARRSVALGRWDVALESFERAAAVAGAAQPGDTARRERQALAAWFAPPVPSPVDWTGTLRLAVARDPLGVVGGRDASLPASLRGLVAGLAALVAGQPRDAVDRLERAEEAPDASSVIGIGAGVAASVARALMGESVSVRLVALSEQAEAIGASWLAGLARAAVALDVAAGEVTPVPAKEDPWGSAAIDLLTGIGCLIRRADCERPLGDAAAAFTALDAGALAAWANAGAAIARARREGPAAAPAVHRAVQTARALGLPGVAALASIGFVFAEPDRAAAHRTVVDDATREFGLALTRLLPDGDGNIERADGRADGHAASGPDADGARPRADAAAAPTATSTSAAATSATAVPATGAADADAVAVRCLGSFALRVDGHDIELAAVKPRVRSLVRLLAMHGGRPVHRERIIEALWPEGDARVGTRNLQVAVSSLRQLLEPGVARGAASIVVRDGDAYRLAVDGDIDVVRFEAELAAARTARSGGDPTAARDAFAAALRLYRGDLLPEEGPAEWVVGERDRLRAEAANAALAVAELALEDGDGGAAVRAAEHGVHLDQYRDRLWRVLIQAHEDAGDAAAAQRARDRYAVVLDQLGVH